MKEIVTTFRLCQAFAPKRKHCIPGATAILWGEAKEIINLFPSSAKKHAFFFSKQRSVCILDGSVLCVLV